MAWKIRCAATSFDPVDYGPWGRITPTGVAVQPPRARRCLRVASLDSGHRHHVKHHHRHCSHQHHQFCLTPCPSLHHALCHSPCLSHRPSHRSNPQLVAAIAPASRPTPLLSPRHCPTSDPAPAIAPSRISDLTARGCGCHRSSPNDCCPNGTRARRAAMYLQKPSRALVAHVVPRSLGRCGGPNLEVFRQL